MKKFTLVALAAVAGLSLAACNAQDRTEVKEGAQAAGSEIKDAAQTIANDPDVKEAGAAIGDAGQEAAGAVKEAAQNVQDGVADASAEAKQEADEARAAVGDTSRSNEAEKK